MDQQGADYAVHWSFRPLRSGATAPPAPAQVSQAIDFFIDRQLRQQQLTPAPSADRATLLRRLHLDLTGLPPTPSDVRDFVNSTDPEAFRQWADRLLASPHFGERMAIWWLDLVRYADSVGYHGDQEISVSPYRDYVIQSFNANKPFDQFTIEQLAGDLLPDNHRTLLVASGYNRLGMMSAEGGVQDKEYLAKYIAERVRNVAGTWLGLTMGCCECHDHKYDPLTTREFYQLEAFFADIKERGLYAGANADGNWGPSIKVPTADQETARLDLKRQIGEIELRLGEDTAELRADQANWERSQPVWTALRPIEAVSDQGSSLTIREDWSVLASGELRGSDVYRITVKQPPSGLTAFRLEVLPDASLPHNGPGRAGNGNFVLTEFFVAAEQAAAATSANSGDQPPRRQLKFRRAAASHEQTDAAQDNPYGKWAVEAAIDGDIQGKQWGWAILDQPGTPHRAVFELDADQAPTTDESLLIELHFMHDDPTHTLGCFRLWATNSPRPLAGDLTIPIEVESIVALPVDQRPESQSRQLASYFRSIAPRLEPLREQQLALRQAETELERQLTVAQITEAVPPRTVRVLPRGNWMDNSGEEVEPGFPAAIEVPAFTLPTDRRLNRLDLALWITASDNPLTARVLVNRLWKLFFGVGLSHTLDDVGAQGQPPTHPELLDYLAGQLIQSRWDLKSLIRSLVLSAAYQRSSVGPDQLVAADPANHWLARQNRFRLEAELVRDNALAISGLLVRDPGGRSVRPYQPPGYWAYLNFPTREWSNDSGQQLYRRGLYTHWQRQYLHPSLMAFDAPSREECTADRPRSNTPLQALVLLNDPIYVEAARAFAALITQQAADSDEERMQWAFQRALMRSATAQELQVLSELLQAARLQYAAESDAAAGILAVGDAPLPMEPKAGELAAWTAVGRTILNLHEAITRY